MLKKSIFFSWNFLALFPSQFLSGPSPSFITIVSVLNFYSCLMVSPQCVFLLWTAWWLVHIESSRVLACFNPSSLHSQAVILLLDWAKSLPASQIGILYLQWISTSEDMRTLWISDVTDVFFFPMFLPMWKLKHLVLVVIGHLFPSVCIWKRAWQPTLMFLPGESPWTEEPVGLQSLGWQRVRHGWVPKHTHFGC